MEEGSKADAAPPGTPPRAAEPTTVGPAGRRQQPPRVLAAAPSAGSTCGRLERLNIEGDSVGRDKNIYLLGGKQRARLRYLSARLSEPVEHAFVEPGGYADLRSKFEKRRAIILRVAFRTLTADPRIHRVRRTRARQAHSAGLRSRRRALCLPPVGGCLVAADRVASMLRRSASRTYSLRWEPPPGREVAVTASAAGPTVVGSAALPGGVREERHRLCCPPPPGFLVQPALERTGDSGGAAPGGTRSGGPSTGCRRRRRTASGRGGASRGRPLARRGAGSSWPCRAESAASSVACAVAG